MSDLNFDPESVIMRCIMDFVRRDGVSGENASEVAARVIESLKLVGYRIESKDQ